MKITNVTLTEQNDTIVLSADIAFRGSKPETMYLITERANLRTIAKDASPFLAAVLLPCMKTGEDVTVEGSISRKLFDNIAKIQELVSGWQIGLQRIQVTASEISTDTFSGRRIASFFSAGVDSFYTYLAHKSGKKTAITDFILVHGFDIPLANSEFFKSVSQTVREIAQEAKIHLIPVETNIAEIVERRLIWDFAHGGALAAVALFLRKEMRTVYIPGSVQRDELFPYGTHPDLDPLWSTETLSLIHDGSEYNRLGKIVHTVAHSPLALRHLRVCTQMLKGTYNCSHCYKCMITMLYLTCAGVLSDAATFDHSVDLNAVREMYYDYSLQYNQQGEAALAYLRQHNREPALQAAIAYSLERSKHPSLAKKISKALAALDQKFFGRRVYMLIFRMNRQHDRNFLFKFLQKKGLLK